MKRIKKALHIFSLAVFTLSVNLAGLNIPNIKPAKAASDFDMRTGYYVGTGNAGHTLSGLGFQPDFVLIKAESNAGVPIFKTSTMPANNSSFTLATADNTASQITLTSDGFSVGTIPAVNSVNLLYYWIAFGGSNCTSSGVFCVGTYTGDGSSPRAITTGFQPEWAIVKRNTAVGANWRTSAMPANNGAYFATTATDTGGALFTTISSNGFAVGSTNNVNTGTYN